jgi:integrase
MPAKRSPEGVRARHSRTCRSADGGACNCRPSWEAFVYLKHEDRKVRKTFPTRAAAVAWRRDAAHAAQRGRLRVPSAVTVAEAAAELLAGMADGSIPNRKGDRYKPAAVRGYERCLRLRVLPALGHVRLSEVRRADVQDLADRLTGEGLSASTVQNTLDPLRVIFRRAVRRDLVAVDPTEGLELRRKKGRRDRIATPAEAAALLAALADEDRALWATALYAGLRRGELRALRWDDVDLTARTIRVEREWDDVEGELNEAKSEAGTRTVPLAGPLVSLLAAHRLRTGRAGQALVFGATEAEPFTPSTVRRRALRAWGWREAANPEADGPRRVRVAAREGALEPIGLHEARHTCASVLIASGANPKVIQNVMGHATIVMTFDQYGHLMPGGLEDAREAMDAYLAGATG